MPNGTASMNDRFYSKSGRENRTKHRGNAKAERCMDLTRRRGRIATLLDAITGKTILSELRRSPSVSSIGERSDQWREIVFGRRVRSIFLRKEDDPMGIFV